MTDADDMHQRLLSVRNHGRGDDGFDTFGLNMRMPEVCAAIGHVQMKKLPSFIDIRRRNARNLTGLLKDAKLTLPRPRRGEEPNWGLYTITTPDRNNMWQRMKHNGVGATVYYDTPIHLMPHYQTGVRLPNTQTAADRVLSLPVHPGVSQADIERVADLAVQKLTKQPI